MTEKVEKVEKARYNRYKLRYEKYLPSNGGSCTDSCYSIICYSTLLAIIERKIMHSHKEIPNSCSYLTKDQHNLYYQNSAKHYLTLQGCFWEIFQNLR